MTVLAGPVVDAGWLAAHLGDEGLVVLDASIGDPLAVRIPGAGRFDLDGRLSDGDDPLPHTMPHPERLAVELGG